MTDRIVTRADAAVDRAWRLVTTSAIVRWLTRPPSGDPIVVDVRDSRVLGPVAPGLLALADAAERGWNAVASHRYSTRVASASRQRPVRIAGLAVLGLLAAWFLTAWPDAARGDLGVASVLAGLALLATRVDASAADLASTVPGRLLAALVIPPEEPRR